MSIGLIHRRLDRSRLILENKLKPQVLLFLDKLTNQVTLDLTNKLKKAKYRDPVDWGAIEDIGISYVKPILVDTFAQGANAAYGVVGLRGVYDIYNPDAVDAVNKICSKMIQNITEETRKAINRQIAVDIEEGAGYYNIMQDLRSFVGLTDLQAQKVESFKAWLAREYPDAPVKEVNQRVSLMRGRLIEQRLSTITRTESARAQNYGFVTAMESFGVDQFEFSAYPGCCEACQDLDGNKFGMDQADEIIPVHPNCRCALLPVIGSHAAETPLSNFPSSLEEPTMEKKFRFTTLAERLTNIAKGSSSSGNYAHEGRPGEVGGSTPGGGSSGKNNSIDSASKEAASILGIDSSDVRYEGMTVEHANEFNVALAKFKDKFPDSSVMLIRQMSERELLLQPKANMVAIPGGMGNVITYNGKKYSDNVEVQRVVDKAYNSGWSAGNSVEDRMIHELGHTLVYDNFRSSGLNATSVAFTTKLKELDSVKFTFDGDVKSRYGTKNGNEGLAESVSVYMKTGGFDGIKISDGRPVASVLKEYTGKDFK